MKYLVKMTPLEPYSFGNDQNFAYPGEKATGKESYFVRSKDMPEQTTVLGLLRYLVLQEKGLLRTDFKYTKEERELMKECIGERSFSYLEKEPQNFGYIHEVSPVFLINEREEILIKNPFHNKAKEFGYEPVKMEEAVETSNGIISLPAEGEYDAKEGYSSGYFNIKLKEIIAAPFATNEVPGNRKNEKNGNDENCFFKREIKYLKKGYSFAVYAEVEELPQKAIGYMGKKKSAFLIETKEVEDIDLCMQVQSCFTNGDTWYYALSDIVLSEAPQYEEFCIVEEKYQRNLETVHDAKDHYARLKKSEIRHHLIQSGSVFYKTMNINLEHANAQKIGYNKVVRLGGK